MKLQLKAGTTSKSIGLFIQDSSSTTGAGLTGLVYNTSSLVCYYWREGGSATSVTLATLAAINSAFSSGGFKECDATNMPGVYRLDLPDAAIAASAKWVIVMLKGATNMAPIVLEIDLVTYDPYDSVRLGLTALPNAAAEAAGGLYTRGSGAGQINQSANGQVDVNCARLLNTAFATPATAGVIDVNLKNIANAAVSASTAQLGVNVVNFGGSAGTFASGRPEVNASHIAGSAVSTASAQIGVNVVNAGGTAWGSGAITAASIAADAITAAKVAADVSQEIRTEMDSNSTKLANLDATISSRLASASYTAPDNSTIAAIAGYVDTEVAAIKAVTDALPDAGALTSLATAASIAALNDLDAAGVRSAVGLASANLDTQLDALPTAAENATAVLTTQMTESYAANGVAPTLAQALFALHQSDSSFAIAGTSKTVTKLDGATTAFVATLDSDTAPTAIARS